MFVRLSNLLDRTSFPRIDDPEAEARKVAVLRLVTGSLLVWRCALMLRDSWFYFDPVPIAGGTVPLYVLAAGAETALALGLLLGVAPALCAVLLLATHPAYSVWTGTYNLGLMLLMPTLGAFAALETGRLTLAGRVRAVPTAAQYRLVYFIVFVAYAGLNFQALLYHLGDSYWINGQTPAVLFVSSYLSRYYRVFRAWEAATPGLFALCSMIVVVLQSAFQLLMLPLTGTRWGARFVLFWGSAFILLSLMDLQLSILPLVEVIVWILVFSPGRWFAGARAPLMDGATRAPSRGRTAAIAVFCGTYGLLLLFFFGNAVATFALERGLPGWIQSSWLAYSGLDAPNVFNREDLKMGDLWPVMERLDGPAPGPVPFTGPEGERLSYHLGDLLYFGDSLRWRRGMIDADDLLAYHRPGGAGYEYARRVALYNHRRRGDVGPVRYRVTIFRNRASVFALGADPDRYRPEPVLQFTVPAGPPTPS